jgi:hypothetical protein
MDHEPDKKPPSRHDDGGDEDTQRETATEIGEQPTLRWIRIAHDKTEAVIEANARGAN